MLFTDSNTQVMSNSSLRIAQVSTGHYGEYKCVATNSVGAATLSLHLTNSGLCLLIVYNKYLLRKR